MFMVGMQMYTLRNEANADLEGTFKAVAEIGYPGVQISGIKAEAGRIAEVVKKFGLEAKSAHIALARMESDLDGVIADARTVGYTDIAVPSLPADRRQDAAGWEALAKLMDRIGADLKKEGIQLSYHNHAFEFAPLAGTTGYEIIWKNASLENLQPEIDTYWVAFGGGDAAELLRRFAGHINLVHAKDGKLGVEKADFKPVGDGDLEWPPIIEASKEGSANWFLVEQDRCDGPPIEAARRSFENISRMLGE